MLTEPDMQARYVAATLSVIEAELRKIVTGADRCALFALVSGAARAAARLADDLAASGRIRSDKAESCSAATAAAGGNIIAFRR